MERYMLFPTGDKSDRKAEIEKLLHTYKVCILGSGEFYVSGIEMPDGATLQGIGECSQIVLLPEIEEGYAVKLASYCRVQNLTFKGKAEEEARPTELGGRHAIGFLGDSEPQNRGIQHRCSLLDNLRITDFSGGGITCIGTGYSVDSSLNVTNCRIRYCGAGIYIPYFSEFHKFTNVMCNDNFYGCINNGGNNVFTACSFDRNTVGFEMDGRDKKAPNNTHGSVIGCTFNHTDSNKGIGIKIHGTNNGYIFTACQCFFSQILVEDSLGIQFSHFNCGKEEKITVRGGGLVTFFGCSFSGQPTITVEDNDSVHFRDCYLRKTGEAVPKAE